jgi:TrmH family RNA methyltransferase
MILKVFLIMTFRPPLHITSLSNPKIKDIVRLRQRSHRDDADALLIEGYRELKRALDNNYTPKQIVTCAELFMGSHEQLLIDRCMERGAMHITCTVPVFKKISARDRPDGLIATGPQIRTSLSELSLPPNALVVVTEGIEKPGNLGTILRSADSAGADAVIVCDHKTDIQNPNVVRASIGTLFALPVVEADTEEAISFLVKNKFLILASTPHAERLHVDCDLAGNTAIVVGAEQYGLSGAWLNSPDIVTARIPMLGQSDSLNVASAATILLYEAVRQRVAKDRTIVPPPHEHEQGGDDPHDRDCE